VLELERHAAHRLHALMLTGARQALRQPVKIRA
jgi:hypothetical protein